MNSWYALLLAQIMFESLPISSSGHCLLLKSYYQMAVPCNDTYLMYLAHAPTAVVICCYFFKQWIFLLVHIARCWSMVVKITCYTISADIVTVILYGVKKTGALDIIPVSVGLCMTACLLYSLRWCRTKPSVWNLHSALILGLVKGIAFIPGISRFAITFVTACWLGIVPRRAFQISFLLHWPLIVASCLYSYYVLGPSVNELLNLPLLLGMLFSGIIAYGMLSGVAWMAHRNYLWIWSLYLIILAYISFLWEL